MRPYRAPLAPNAAHAAETIIDEICERIGMDPIEFRLKNAAKKGTKAAYGPVYPEIGMVETLQVAKSHPHYDAPLGLNQGRGVASGFWINIGGDATANISVLPDGRVSLVTGRPDIGGSRAAPAMVDPETGKVDGVRGVGENAIVAPLAAVANAIHDATGVRSAARCRCPRRGCWRPFSPTRRPTARSRPRKARPGRTARS